jgi:hypothetical protein
MNAKLREMRLPLLRWTVAAVVFVESLEFAFSASAAHFVMKIGLPVWVPPALGSAEAIAAVLFVLPVTTVVGGALLLVIFALAALIHMLHGQFEVGALVVYAAAVLVCMPAPNQGNQVAE